MVLLKLENLVYFQRINLFLTTVSVLHQQQKAISIELTGHNYCEVHNTTEPCSCGFGNLILYVILKDEIKTSSANLGSHIQKHQDILIVIPYFTRSYVA